MIKSNTGILILAAGSSTRLGFPKQLLTFEGKTLIERAVTAAMESVASKVFVVLGSSGELIKKNIEGYPVTCILNPQWREGISSSIRAGLLSIQSDGNQLTDLLIMACDQPYISSDLLNEIISNRSDHYSIVASSYATTIGIPALFNRRHFNELLLLKGDHGAKRIIRANLASVRTVTFPDGEKDIDTPDDFMHFLV